MRLFGLIGFPLTHSFSKNYFTEKFRKEGLDDCRYENFQLPAITDLPMLIAEHPGLRGFNVTIPYKQDVLQFLHERDDLVTRIGACNCVQIVNGKLVGYNTDVMGFERSLLAKLQPFHKRALILGTGGAARAVEYVLAKNGINYISVSRTAKPRAVTYEAITPAMFLEHLLIINTTPVGMFPHVNEIPSLPYDLLTPRHFLFDLVYNPERTLFLSKGEEKNALVQNGYDMLVYQAEGSWEIWNQ